MERGHLLAALVLAAAVAGCTAGSGTAPDTGADGAGNATAAWMTTEMTTVRGGETFRIADLEPPVLVETFAVWCSTCLRQQQEVERLHGDSSATTVTLNVDPNEDAARVRSFLDRHGFDWRYAVAPPAVTASLREEFGNSILIPPRAPVVLVCDDGVRRLQDGVKTAETLRQEIEAGC